MNDNQPLTPNQCNKNNALLDMIIERAGLLTDAELSRFLKVAPPVVSKIRHGKLPIGATMMIRMQMLTWDYVNPISLREINEYVPIAFS